MRGFLQIAHHGVFHDGHVWQFLDRREQFFHDLAPGAVLVVENTRFGVPAFQGQMDFSLCVSVKVNVIIHQVADFIRPLIDQKL